MECDTGFLEGREPIRMDTSVAIQVEHVTKQFGDFVAVRDVSLELKTCDSIGIIGPNGAGKTTLVNLITGYYAPDRGNIRIFGKEISALSPPERVSLGMLRTFQLVHVFDNLSVYENVALSLYRKQTGNHSILLSFFRTLVDAGTMERVEEVLDLFHLSSLEGEQVGNLSLGDKKKLELAMIYVVDPEVMILDEPFAGLGDQEIDEILPILKNAVQRQKKTMLIVEHKLSKLTSIVENIAVMHEGAIIASGPCEETLNHPEVRRSYWKLDGCPDPKEKK